MTPHRLPIIAVASLSLMGSILAQRAPVLKTATRTPSAPSMFVRVMELFSSRCGTSKCHGVSVIIHGHVRRVGHTQDSQTV